MSPLSVNNLKAGSVTNPFSFSDPGYNAALGAEVGKAIVPPSGGTGVVQSAQTTASPPATGGLQNAAPALNYTPADLQAYQSGLGAINTTASNSFGSLYDNLMASADQIGATDKSAQMGIDQSRVNNQLNRMQGIQSIMDYVRGGIQSAGAQLANNNAGDSSGGDALSRLYSMYGNQQARGVDNQAAIQDNSINTQQGQLALQNQSSTSQLQRYRDAQVQSISTDIAQRLAVLDQQAAGLSLPGKVDINAQKQQLIDAGNAQVNQVDQYLQGLLSGVSPEGADQVLASANQLRTAGTAGSSPFSVASPTSGGLQPLSGPALDQLPIYVTPNKNQLQTATV